MPPMLPTLLSTLSRDDSACVHEEGYHVIIHVAQQLLAEWLILPSPLELCSLGSVLCYTALTAML